jgi:hypothetical protein
VRNHHRRSVRWGVAAAAIGLFAAASPANGAEPGAGLALTDHTSGVSISAGEHKVIEYRARGAEWKPYLKELCTPAGVQVLRDSPHDHKHHHALMFAVAVDGVDFWSENAACGRQAFRALQAVKPTTQDGATWAGLVQQLDWIAPKAEKPLAAEQRTVGVWQPKDAGATIVTWQTRLEPAEGRPSVKLGGSHYFGLGVRFVESMDKGGRFFNADPKEGEVVRGQERLTRTRWCAYAAKAGDKPVTVAMFDHPKNARHPALFFTMPAPFAYISATLNYWKEPLEVKAGQPLELRYAVAAWDGQIGADQVEKLYQRWTAEGR